MFKNFFSPLFQFLNTNFTHTLHRFVIKCRGRERFVFVFESSLAFADLRKPMECGVDEMFIIPHREPTYYAAC